MSDSTIKGQQESYRQLSPEQLVDIYTQSRLAGEKRATDVRRQSWTWKEFSYVLALVLILSLILIEYIN